MVQKNEHHTFTGMQKDIAISKHPSKYLFDARNIRLTQREDGSTLFAITNEKGTEDTELEIEGIYLGHCMLNEYLIVFSTNTYEGVDYIDRINLSTLEKVSLYAGNLGFSVANPIEAIGSYENKDVQKVYWTDGLNQPRVINIMDTNEPPTNTYFDFVNTLKLEEEVSIQKILGANGMFPSGVIQYAFTYYNKYGQESSIFYTTPLLYVSFIDRGGNPEEKISNAFSIKVEKLDTNFDYLRIYSIQRTSINGTPIVKRVQDISIDSASYIDNNDHTKGKYITFIDTGTEGNTVDPTELIYKGGECIKAETIEQKDGTLFLGNISIARDSLKKDNFENTIVNNINVVSATRKFKVNNTSSGAYTYGSQLSALQVVTESGTDTITNTSVPCGGFKHGNYYRLGVQFQHESGKWSDPIPYDDVLQEEFPGIDNANGIVTVPTFDAEFSEDNNHTIQSLIDKGYKKVRGVVVFPEPKDRVVVCQGVTNPTMRTLNNTYHQSSWFFRPLLDNYESQDNITASPKGILSTELDYLNKGDSVYDKALTRNVEIQGSYSLGDKFEIKYKLMTLHTPDAVFNEDFWNYDFTGNKCKKVGNISFQGTLSDIDIQTETPTASISGNGFVHPILSTSGNNSSFGIISGVFYDDFVVDDHNSVYEPYIHERSSVKWLVYAWNKSGSLNNDFNRAEGAGTRTAVLKKKVISNLRYAITEWDSISEETEVISDFTPTLFSSDQLNLLKLGAYSYLGNIDTLLTPEKADGMYFAFNDDGDASNVKKRDVVTELTEDILWKTYSTTDDTTTGNATDEGLWKYVNNTWGRVNTDIGDKLINLVQSKESVRMKYKSTPHLIIDGESIQYETGLPVVEVQIPGDTSSSSYRNTMFGGKRPDAFKENVWLPCGEPVSLAENNNTAKSTILFSYSYGDTYYQRWDCLKTYAFTPEDINQVVEIGSFMLETYVNIDGRYDRNRGQLSNLNMSPQNFNLLNPVYSQLNNFFTYKILDEDYYKNNTFPNQITWTKEKHAGADVDLWTNITLASTYDMDGSKGKIVSLNAWKDQLFCFQDKGISNILFNSRVQIPTSDGVPIEISNNYKVDGYRYLSDGIGCSNKWTIRETPASIYFIDSTSHHLYSIGEGFTNLTVNKNMGSWFNSNGALINKTVYDDVHHDVYLVKDDEALCYSELLGEFTSFMDYGGMNVLESYQGKVFSMKGSLSDKHLYKMFTGNYNYFFDDYKPWYLTFISNGIDESAMDFDKIFSNIDYRLDFFDEGIYDPDETFDYMRAWNEYQDTQEVTLSTKNDGKGYKTAKFYRGGNPQKKFRIWRIQIPRAKKLKNGQYVPTNDRMRNPWCKITLGKNADESNMKAILQDLNVQYFL